MVFTTLKKSVATYSNRHKGSGEFLRIQMQLPTFISLYVQILFANNCNYFFFIFPLSYLCLSNHHTTESHFLHFTFKFLQSKCLLGLKITHQSIIVRRHSHHDVMIRQRMPDYSSFAAKSCVQTIKTHETRSQQNIFVLPYSLKIILQVPPLPLDKNLGK